MTDSSEKSGFFSRWSRRKRAAAELTAEGRDPPTLPDIAALGPGSDYAAFMAKGVDVAVKRLALKKLFADPHFNLMDGLDIYISDYTRSDPVAPAMLASLAQAQAFLKKSDDVVKNAVGGDAAAAKTVYGTGPVNPAVSYPVLADYAAPVDSVQDDAVAESARVAPEVATDIRAPELPAAETLANSGGALSGNLPSGENVPPAGQPC